jgi:hypothetical protein
MIRDRFFLLCAAASIAACQASTNDSAQSDPPAASARPIERGASAVTTPEPLVIPEGTALAMTLQTTASSATSHEGDAVVAKLAESVRLGDRVLVPAGSEVRGRVIAAVPSGKVKGRARLALDFDSIVVKGREVAIDTAPIDITARHQKKRDAAIIGGGTGAGAIVGGIVDGKKGAAIGALLGAGAGGGAVLATKGKEVHLPSGTALKIRLKEPARIA